MKVFVSSAFVYLCIASLLHVSNGDIDESYGSYGLRNRPLLHSFDGFKYDITRESDGIYKFSYHVGDSSRTEQRNADGLVTGEYAFVVPEGEEVDVKYEADSDGFRVESDALPVTPDETDDVKRAREIFFREYKKALERAGEEEEEDEEDSDEDDDDDEESSSEESSEEDDDELSLFTYYGFDSEDESGIDDSESSEEDGLDSDDEEDDEEEDEEEEEGEEETKGIQAIRGQRKFISSPSFAHFGRRLSVR